MEYQFQSIPAEINKRTHQKRPNNRKIQTAQKHQKKKKQINKIVRTPREFDQKHKIK